MKGRGSIVFRDEIGGPRTGTIEMAGPWVHFLPDARPHEQQEDVQAITFNHRDVYAVYWDVGTGAFAAPALRSAA